MEKKIKLLYNGNILSYDYKKTCSRSGIFFVALKVLKELIKHENIEVTFYADVANIYGLKNFIKLNPEFSDIKVVGKFTFYHYLLGVLQYYRYKCRKLDQKDNIIKKGVRFITTRLLKFFNGFKFQYKDLIKQADDYDAFISPYEAVPEFLRDKKLKKFTIIYDTIPLILPEYNPASTKDSWFMNLISTINIDDYYFSISEYTKKDFIKYSPNINPAKIFVIPLACSADFKPCNYNIDNIKTKYNIPLNKKYIFSLCTLEPRKNLVRAVKTFFEFIKKNNIDDLVFVLGGGHWDMFIKTLENEIKNIGEYKDKIIRAGYIDDEDLAPLYSNAEWFVYTSMYEGFGLPPLEAMSCGCPVITSNNSSLPEVVGDAGIMIDYDSDEQHIKAYEKYYFNPELRKEYSKKGLERAASFSWKKCADKMVEVIKQNC